MQDSPKVEIYDSSEEKRTVDFSDEELKEIEELPFKERIVVYEQKLEDIIIKYEHWVAEDSTETKETELCAISYYEDRYIKSVCEACETDFNWWRYECVDRLLYNCIQDSENKRSMRFFELYRKARKARCPDDEN